MYSTAPLFKASRTMQRQPELSGKGEGRSKKKTKLHALLVSCIRCHLSYAESYIADLDDGVDLQAAGQAALVHVGSVLHVEHGFALGDERVLVCLRHMQNVCPSGATNAR